MSATTATPDVTRPVIALIGTGVMGAPLALYLIKKGYKLRVHSRSKGRAADILTAGGVWCDSAIECATGASLVFSCVANDEQLKQVLNGPNGVLSKPMNNKVFVSLSTISSKTSEAMCSEVERCGGQWVTSVMIGEPNYIAAGMMIIFYSYLKPQLHDLILPVFKDMSGKLVDCGPKVGAANTMKLCMNFIIYGQCEAIAEASALAEKNGLDPTEMMNSMNQLAPSVIATMYSKQITQKEHGKNVIYNMEKTLKDANLFCDAANDVKCPMPLAGLIRDRCMETVAHGMKDLDWSAFTLLSFKHAGIDVSKHSTKPE